MRGKGVILLSLLLIISAVLIIEPAESSNALRTEQAPMPTWHVGDMWNYSFWMHEEGTDEYGLTYSLDYTGSINASIIAIEIITVNGNNYDVYVAEINYDISGSGTYDVHDMTTESSINETYYYLRSNLSTVKEISNITTTYNISTTPPTVITYSNLTETTYTPPKNDNNFPIVVGEQWSVDVNAHMVWHTVINDIPEDGAGDKAVNKTYKCVETTSICVAAGTYNVFVINSTIEDGNETSYYSPDVCNFVRSEFYDENGELTGEADLVSYSIGTIQTRSVSGRVTSDGTPLQDADITARYTSNNTIAGTMLTNATGDYTISDLPADTYNVTASKSGYVSSYQTVNLTASCASNIDFTLNATPTTGIITGHVYISGTNTGIHNANVSINATTYAITDANGAYTLSGVIPGTHPVTASASDYASSYANVIVTAGQTSFHNFTLTPLSETGNITGVVKDENNHTLSGATVSIVGTIYSNTTDANGHYTITGVPAGTYNVTSSKTGYVSSTKNVTVTAKNTTELNFVLTVSADEKRGSISGTVKDKNGNPVAGATVKAYYANDTVAGTAYTNATGDYTLSNLLPGTYTVKVSKAGFQEYSMSVTLSANQTLTSKDAALTSETDGSGSRVVDEGGIGISGYWWIAVVIAVIIVVVIVVLKKRLLVGRRMPTPRDELVREEIPVREEFAPEKPVGKRFCIKCGREISKTAVFCPHCGYRFKK